MEDVQAQLLSDAAVAEGIKALKDARSKVETAPGCSTAALESELSDTTTSAQRVIIGMLANRRVRTSSLTWKH